VLEVAHRQLADGGVDRLARAQARVVGLGERAPTPVSAIHRQHVVGIAHGFEIHQQRRIAEAAQCHGREQRAFHAVRDAALENRAGGIAGGALWFLVVADLLIEESLDFDGCGQTVEHPTGYRKCPRGCYTHGHVGVSARR